MLLSQIVLVDRKYTEGLRLNFKYCCVFPWMFLSPVGTFHPKILFVRIVMFANFSKSLY